MIGNRFHGGPVMSEHDRFEELCALAAAGQITQGELAELQAHLQHCPDCRELKGELTEILALWPSPDIRSEADCDYAQSELKHRVLRDLEGVGAKFSSSVQTEISSGAGRSPVVGIISVFGQPTTWVYAAVAIVVGIIGFGVGSYRTSLRSVEQNVAAVQAVSVPQDSGKPVPNSKELAESKQEEQESAAAESELRKRLAASEEVRNTVEHELVALKRKVADLEDARNRDTAEIARLHSALGADKEQALNADGKLRKLEEMQSGREADLVAAQYRVRELEAKLAEQSQAAERDRQMLLMASSSEMRDVIGARNLHIIDVIEVDNSGPRKAFGRVFYTEGKSMIFYAYDLANTKKTQTFYAWGHREGQPQTTKALGALINDDKEQSRWVFRCNDSKVLAQIDSVYVTLEPTNRPGDKPRGKRLLDAYLGAPANHP